MCVLLIFRPVHSTQEKFENGVFTLKIKTHQMFSVHTTPEKIYRNATIYGHFGFVFVEISVREIKWLSWSHRKLRFQNVLRPHWNKTRSRRFQIPPVWRAFWKLTLSFRDRLVWTVGLTVEIKLDTFLNPSGVVWAESGVNHDVNERHQPKGAKQGCTSLFSKPLYIS